MLTYFRVFQTVISEFFVYRFNFILWRLRNILGLLIKYFLWLAVFEQSHTVFGYDKSHMLTYILLSTVIADIAISTKTADIAGEILKGDIINYILRPIAFFKYHLARDLGDKFLNIFFSIFEVVLVLILLKTPIVVQTNPFAYVATGVFIIIGITISFFINMSMSFIAFWSNEVWAPRFIFYMLLLIFAGSYFPLDVLPKTLYYAFFLTPFPYLFYLPTRIYLGASLIDIGFFFISGLVWVVLSYKLTKMLWNKGMREFSFFGR